MAYDLPADAPRARVLWTVTNAPLCAPRTLLETSSSCAAWRGANAGHRCLPKVRPSGRETAKHRRPKVSMHMEIPWARRSSKAMGSSPAVSTARLVAEGFLRQGCAGGTADQALATTAALGAQSDAYAPIRPLTTPTFFFTVVHLCGLSRWMPDSPPVADLRRGSIGFLQQTCWTTVADGSNRDSIGLRQ